MTTPEEARANRQMLRSLVRGAYDIQKLRIQMSNRLCANFKAKLGMDLTAPEDKADADSKRILTYLRNSHKKLSEGVVGSTRSRMLNFTGDEIISTYTELNLVAQYLQIEEVEKDHFKRMAIVLEKFPIYVEFLDKVKGIGPAIGGVLLSEIDIHKATYASNLFSYAGLDVVLQWEKTSGEGPKFILELPDEDAGEAIISPDGDTLTVIWNDGKEGEYEMKGRGRSRRAEHLVDREYKKRDGTLDTKKSITFNPFLKTKLMGVLATSFIKQGTSSPYRRMYNNYKARLENSPEHASKTKAHRHAMAMRYMVKRFLSDLYVEWRTLEGLPVAKPYEEEKLGIIHHEVKPV